MIRSFRDLDTEKTFRGQFSKKFQGVACVALRRLIQLNQARKWADLRLPGNHLESWSGDRHGQYSIRINDQYRVCFCWSEQGADDVEITDYH